MQFWCRIGADCTKKSQYGCQSNNKSSQYLNSDEPSSVTLTRQRKHATCRRNEGCLIWKHWMIDVFPSDGVRRSAAASETRVEPWHTGTLQHVCIIEGVWIFHALCSESHLMKTHNCCHCDVMQVCNKPQFSQTNLLIIALINLSIEWQSTQRRLHVCCFAQMSWNDSVEKSISW